MGFYHYKLGVIPTARKAKEEEPLKDTSLAQDFLAGLRVLLPQNTNWGPVEEYKSENEWGSDLRIWHSGDLVENSQDDIESIEFRFSPLGDAIEMLNTFVRLVSDQGFKLISHESNKILEPLLSSVMEDLKHSKAFEALQDPESALQKAVVFVAETDGQK